jgi:hypothetical protein
MSNIKKLPTRKLTQKKSSVVPFKRGEHGTVINLEEKINKAIELRLGKFVKEIQRLKAKQKKIEAREKIKCEKGNIEPIEKIKQIKAKEKQKTKSIKNKKNTKKPKK